jgi:hypothetical protein
MNTPSLIVKVNLGIVELVIFIGQFEFHPIGVYLSFFNKISF